MTDEQPSTAEISRAIHLVCEAFEEEYGVSNPTKINAGKCEEFAERVNERLDGELDILTTADVIGGEREAKPEPWHVWLTDGEYHYDAEVPVGTETWSSIPFFGRVVGKEPML